jgi:hypothetical protein
VCHRSPNDETFCPILNSIADRDPTLLQGVIATMGDRRVSTPRTASHGERPLHRPDGAHCVSDDEGARHKPAKFIGVEPPG